MQLEGELDNAIPPIDAKKEMPHYSPKEYSLLSSEEKTSLREQRAKISIFQQGKQGMEQNDASDNNASGKKNVHPTLGPVIIDLGYKRVHAVSSGRLGTIPIWKKQRTYRYDRVKRMADEKADHMNLGFPGIICLYEDADGKLFVIDGQHRVGMMQALREKRNKIIEDKTELKEKDMYGETWKDQEKYFQAVLVEVYSEVSKAKMTNSASEGRSYAEQVYVEINKAEPLTLVDIPGVASETERKIISEAVMILKRLYSDMFGSSQRCRSPNVNIDNLRDSIFGSNILKRHNKLTSGEELADWLMSQNTDLGELYERESKRREFIPPKAWKKASKNGFYLGLENSWLYK